MPLPSDADAEANVLSGILVHNDRIHEIVSVIGEDDFYVPAHRSVFRAMVAIAHRGERIDIGTLEAHLRVAGELGLVGGLEGIGKYDRYQTATATAQNARRIREVARQRTAVVVALDIAERGRESSALTDPIGFVEDALARFAALGRVDDDDPGMHVKDIVRGVIGDMKNRREGKRDGLSVEWPDLNDLLRGFRPGQMIVVAARPGIGKTAIALDMCRHLTRKPHAGHLFSIEMDDEEIGSRMLSAEAYVPNEVIDSGKMTGTQFTDVCAAAKRIEEFDLWVDPSTSMPINKLCARARARNAKHKTAFVVVDYIQLVLPTRRGHSRENEVAEVSRGLKDLAKQIKAPVIALCQLNRDADNREPKISDLRESGTLEQDAAKIILLHRPDPAKNITKVIVGKNRRGPTGYVELDFHARSTTFKQPHYGEQR